MTTRVITRYYDRALRASGLKSTQFALLNDISSRAEGISVNDLAGYTMMDQTTVTRSVEVLRKKGYVDVGTGGTDSRKRSITVSEAGRGRLAIATPLWREAQVELERIVGQERYGVLLETLSALRGIE